MSSETPLNTHDIWPWGPGSYQPPKSKNPNQTTVTFASAVTSLDNWIEVSPTTGGFIRSVRSTPQSKFSKLTKELEELIESSPELRDKFMDWLETWSGYYEVEFEVDMDP